jgi:hypothetical protein
MSLYYFHLRDGTDVLLDEEGREMDETDGIAAAALIEARSIISADANLGYIKLDQRIDVEDERRHIVHSLEFADAVEIIPPKAR